MVNARRRKCARKWDTRWRERPIDVAFVGIGENGHLAFNDPPADFDATDPYIVVKLDEACRRQQVNEGWFPSLAEVPEAAISMSVRQILEATAIICVVPEGRKAEAVRAAVEGPVTPGRAGVGPSNTSECHTLSGPGVGKPPAEGHHNVVNFGRPEVAQK